MDEDQDDAATLRALRTVLDAGHLATPDDLPHVLALAAASVGWDATMYLVDQEQRVLVHAPVRGTPQAEPLSIEGTSAGRAFERVEPVRTAGGTGIWLPLLDGVDRLGVVHYTVPASTNLSDPDVEDRYRLLTHLTGHLVAAKTPYGTGLERLTLLRPRTVASELLHSLLPPRTFGCPGLVVSGILEPAYGVAADAYDLDVVGRTANLAILDATGHDLRGTVLSAAALAALRSARKEGRGLYDLARAVDDVVAQQGRHEVFITGVLAELEVRSGRLRYLNAGHPAPLVMRHGKVAKELSGGRQIVFGLGRGEATIAEEHLERDDVLVFYTDGITEARGADGAFFGLDRFTDLLERGAAAGLPAPETLRRVTHAVMEHQRGVLQDDATILVAHWSGGEELALNASR
ncbi:PP2C family protein-serine/threonine phosphatase [Actinotalea ferrariae]|uniref:PP2C family protein-serine/threonine phosphatase n=1 Tax=Actinotalea ferrariae TaxID=1386098 RepID=UPI0027E1922E|nr:PP2C family protein-serine/threonine phosphatase [Actinotalea ferrariae]